jgi:hypothetical protein
MPWVEGEARDEADRPDRLEDAAVAGVEAIERGRRFVGVCGLHVVHVGRVALGSCPPRAPSDPDVRNYRIRLLEQRLRYELR